MGSLFANPALHSLCSHLCTGATLRRYTLGASKLPERGSAPGHSASKVVWIVSYVCNVITRIYTSGTRAQDHTQGIMNIYLLLYIRIFVLPIIAYCLFPFAYCLLSMQEGGCAESLMTKLGQWSLVYETWSRDVVVFTRVFF